MSVGSRCVYSPLQAVFPLLLLMCFVAICSTALAQPSNAPLFGSQSSPPNVSVTKTLDLWNTAFRGMSAVGTVSVAILAIFGQRIRSWLLRPKLAIRAGIASPLVERLSEENENTPGARKSYLELRLEVLNVGKDAGRNCKIICSSYFKQRPGSGGYFQKEFVPRAFYWENKQQKSDLLPKLPEYLVVARIKEEEVATSSGEAGTQRVQSYGLQLALEAEGIKGKFLSVEKGKVLLPLLVYADNIPKVEKLFLELFWDGATPNDMGDEHFSIKLLYKTDVLRVLGGAA